MLSCASVATFAGNCRKSVHAFIGIAPILLNMPDERADLRRPKCAIVALSAIAQVRAELLANGSILTCARVLPTALAGYDQKPATL